MARDIYAEVTDALVAAIEADPGKWKMPWNKAGSNEIPNNIVTQEEYHGVNILNLWLVAGILGFSSNTWGTFRQWKERGCSVRKGEKASPVIFYKQYVKEEGGEEQTIRVLRYFNVFNADQVDGYESPSLKGLAKVDRIKAADKLIARSNAKIRIHGTQAYYTPATDEITMPDDRRFFDTETSSRTENYYSTLFHELTHWTGEPSRCDRDLSGRFGDNSYAMEELVAEIGAAFFCAHVGISAEPREDHAEYLAHWLSVLKADKKAIFAAAARAQEAVDYVVQ